MTITTEPISLQRALFLEKLKYPSPGATETFVYNSMCAIARSSITSYFYRRGDAFDSLSSELNVIPEDLASMSYGEVAYFLARLCHDRCVFPDEWSSEDEASPRIFDPSYSYELVAFLEPLIHTAQVSGGMRKCIPSSEWRDVRVHARRSRKKGPCSLADTDELQDYFDDHFVAGKAQNPEGRIFHAFGFPFRTYCNVVKRIGGNKSALDNALDPFEFQFSEAIHGIFRVIYQLEEVRKKEDLLDDDLYSHDEAVENGITEELIDQVYEALYLLFIQPYALLRRAEFGNEPLLIDPEEWSGFTTTQEVLQGSILDYISSHIEDGELLPRFSFAHYQKPIDSDDPDRPARIADDVQDGGAPRRSVSEDDDAIIAEAVQAASDGRFSEADQLFLKLETEFGVTKFAWDLQRHIAAHRSSIDAGMLYSYAGACISQSYELFLPKVGLAILKSYDEVDEEMKRRIRLLVLTSEYSALAISNMEQWENGNEELFKLAPHTHWVGRNHIIEALEPTTEEIRHWLLHEAMDDTVCGYDCIHVLFWHSGAGDLLYGDAEMSHEEFKAIGRIISSVLSSTDDLCVIDGLPSKDVRRYVEHAAKQLLDIEDYEFLFNLKLAGEYDEIKRRDPQGAEYKEQCERLLHSERCAREVAKAVDEGRAIHIARFLGIPYEEKLAELIECDVATHYWQAPYIEDAKFIPSIVDAFREQFSGVTDSESFRVKLLGSAASMLEGHLPLGLDLIIEGVDTPALFARYNALKTLKCWTVAESMPLQVLSPEAYAAVERAYEDEAPEYLKQMMRNLLLGHDESEEETD